MEVHYLSRLKNGEVIFKVANDFLFEEILHLKLVVQIINVNTHFSLWLLNMMFFLHLSLW